MHVGVKSESDNLFHTEYGIRLMLAPRSASARHSVIPGKSHALLRFLSLFLLDGYGIDACGLGLEALTVVIVGSEIGEVTGLGWTA
uniref:Uncharacterized protein n=1 Tax=Tanacetum cinerariifolium TaxID=118510 RepID=A0A699T4X0_TANCI|nr:hypothetical protein [Tanacetum cinerariifolium]